MQGRQGRLVDIIVGFIDPNAPDEIAAPRIRSSSGRAAPRRRSEPKTTTRKAKTPRKRKPLETGPDPEEAARRFASLAQAPRSSSLKSLRREAAQGPKTLKLRKELAERVHGAQAVAEDVRRAGRASCATCVDRDPQAREADHDRSACATPACRARTSSRRSRRTRPTSRWLDKHIRAKRKQSSALRRSCKDEIERRRRSCIALEERDAPVDRRHQGDQPRDGDRRGARPAAPRRRWSRRTCAS